METKKENYQGQVALITGGARGIGLAAALELASMGYHIVLCSRSEEELKNSKDKICQQFPVECLYLCIDVSVEKKVVELIDLTVKNFKGIHVLVNNAGIQLNKSFLDLSSDEWHRVLGVNLDSAFYFSKYGAKEMIAQKTGGRIINISSVLSQHALPGRLPYSVSKGGMEAMTRTLAAELAPHKILVNTVVPGHVETELIQRDINKGLINRDNMVERSLLKRIGLPEEIGAMVGFLASNRASFITGQSFVVDGGFSIKK